MSDREIYVEIIRVGQALRVAAIDAETGLELVFQVPHNTPRAEIDHLARSKIAWKLKREAGETRETGERKRPDTGSGRGILV